MKRKIVLFLIALFFVITGMVIGRIIQVKSRQNNESEQISSYFESSSEIRYAPGSEYNYTVGGEDVVMSGCTHKYVIDAEIITGGIIFKIYYYDKPNEKKGDLIRQEHITETGEYTYNLDDLRAGSYWFEISEDSEDTTANAKYKFCREKID